MGDRCGSWQARAAELHAALGHLLGLPTRPDAVVITGDLVDRGQSGAYEQLRDLLADVPVPVYLTTGNYDDRDGLRSAFAGSAHLGGGNTTHYVVDLPGAILVVLDSLVPGHGHGSLGAEQLSWLDAVLAQRPDRPMVLALHHPPAPVGIPFLDAMALVDADAFAEVVASHPHVVRVLCGHVHRSLTAAFAGAVVTTAPSTYRQSALDMTTPGTMGYLDEPTSFALHQLTDATGGACVTHTVPVTGAAAVHFTIAPR